MWRLGRWLLATAIALLVLVVFGLVVPRLPYAPLSAAELQQVPPERRNVAQPVRSGARRGKRARNRWEAFYRVGPLCIRTGPLTSTFAACFPPPGRRAWAAERSETLN
jgi:hypothetical protein